MRFLCIALYQPVNFETTIQCNVTMRLSVELRRGVDNQAVPATLLSLTSKHAEDFVMRWQSQLEEASQEDKYWNWHFKQRISETRDNHEAYAVECEGVTQGLIAIETQQHRSVLAPGEPLVYVARLSSAPWNRRQIQEPPQFRRVGTLLLRFSRIRSLALGYKGRVGLHALPNAESFYEHRGMVRFDFPADAYVDDDEPMTYFEYPPRRR